MTSDPRKTALSVLNDLAKGRKTLDRILKDVDDTKDFAKRDRALLNALVYGVLRWRGRLDHIISCPPFSLTCLFCVYKSKAIMIIL